jgi:transposase
MATKRDLAGIEARRIKGARLLKSGVQQAEVARRMGVSRQTVSSWARQLAAVNGAVGKLKAKTLGRPPSLEEAQRGALTAVLLDGALQAGFPTELWTVKRVRLLVQREFGVTYSTSGCWLLLRGLGFSPQKPEKRALQRDEQAIVTWKRKTWPALKKSPKEREELSSSSTSRGSRRSAR